MTSTIVLQRGHSNISTAAVGAGAAGAGVGVGAGSGAGGAAGVGAGCGLGAGVGAAGSAGVGAAGVGAGASGVGVVVGFGSGAAVGSGVGAASPVFSVGRPAPSANAETSVSASAGRSAISFRKSVVSFELPVIADSISSRDWLPSASRSGREKASPSTSRSKRDRSVPHSGHFFTFSGSAESHIGHSRSSPANKAHLKDTGYNFFVLLLKCYGCINNYRLESILILTD